MNKLYKLLLVLPLIIIGCKNKEIDEKYLSQTINTLDMNIFSKEGEKLISIKSPYSYYDKESNTFDLKETTINLLLLDNFELSELIIYSSLLSLNIFIVVSLRLNVFLSLS